jgi:hypothetical protein
VIYLDSEGWFITASDLYDPQGQLWRTIATFNAYRALSLPDGSGATNPYKRSFQTALVDENVQDGTSTVIYMPSSTARDCECWRINAGLDKSFFEPNEMGRVGH